MNIESVKAANLKLPIIGFGYVGQSLAIESGKNHPAMP